LKSGSLFAITVIKRLESCLYYEVEDDLLEIEEEMTALPCNLFSVISFKIMLNASKREADVSQFGTTTRSAFFATPTLQPTALEAQQFPWPTTFLSSGVVILVKPGTGSVRLVPDPSVNSYT